MPNKCLYDDCNKRPTYGLEWGKATHCKKHASDDMMNVVSKRCLYDGCMKLPSYGLEWGKATHCKEHTSEDMANVKHKRCLYDGCNKIPNFGLIWGKATHCKEHASNDMMDVKNKRCEFPLCDTSANPKYSPYCARCYFYLNPNDPHIRNYKTKEHAFMIPLSEQYPEMILDRVVQGGCSKRRPDGLLDCLTHSIIIEIDEGQHIGYDSLCNNRRNMELFTDLGNRPVIFIRLNPDSYKINGKRIKGVFILSKSGELKIDKKEFEKRKAALFNTVEQYLTQCPDKAVSMIELFYSTE